MCFLIINRPQRTIIVFIIKSLEEINDKIIISKVWSIQKKWNLPFHVTQSLIEQGNLGIIVDGIIANNQLSTVVTCKINVTCMMICNM